MGLLKLSYGNEAFREIQNYVKENYHKDYTLSIFDELEQSAIRVFCDFESIVDVVAYISNVEHDFPEWIDINSTSKTYVVGINFTRGNISTSNDYEWENGKLLAK